MPLLLIALVVVPLVEVYLLVQVGQVVGALPTIGLLVLMSVLGGVLLRREGARSWQAFRAALAAGRLPAAEVADGALVILGAALLLTPGFASDVLGLLCVLPGSRQVLRRLLTGFVARRLGVPGVVGAFVGSGGKRRGPGSGAAGPARARGAGAGPAAHGRVVDGSVVDEPGAGGPQAD